MPNVVGCEAFSASAPSDEAATPLRVFRVFFRRSPTQMVWVYAQAIVAIVSRHSSGLRRTVSARTHIAVSVYINSFLAAV